MQSPLDTPLATFARQKPELLRNGHRGKWVLIYGDRVAGIYDSRDQGLRDGYQQFGNVPFLLRELKERASPLMVRSVRVVR